KGFHPEQSLQKGVRAHIPFFKKRKNPRIFHTGDQKFCHTYLLAAAEISSNSRSNRSTEWGGIGPDPSGPYARPDGMSSIPFSPFDIPFRPSSQPGITCPTPTLNSNGSPLL